MVELTNSNNYSRIKIIIKRKGMVYMIYINSKKAKEKLKKEETYVIIDFDRTITDKNSVDSWDASGKELGEEFKEKLNKLYEKYRPIELNYQITYEEKEKAMQTWYRQCMDLYYEYGLTKEILEKSIKESNLIFRTGALEFLKDMVRNKVPVIILSAGIGNVIEFVMKENGLLEENNIKIISNFIKFDQNGKMEKFEDDMIHTLNKTLENHLPKMYENQLIKRPRKLLVGDLIEDKKMLNQDEWNNAIMVGFYNEDNKSNLDMYKDEFDIVLLDEDANFNVLSSLL